MSGAPVTALAIVNRILSRLRENTVTSISDTEYAQLLFGFVNDAKREVEDAFNWDALQHTFDITTTASQQYAVIEDTVTPVYTNQRSRVLEVYDVANVTYLVKQTRDFIRQNTFALNTTSRPFYWASAGIDSNHTQKIEFFQIPDDAYALKVTVVNPLDDLENDDDIITVPWMPVFLRALSMAIQEKGEDGGATSSDIYGQYIQALGDAMAYEQRSKYDGTFDGDWYVP